MKYFYEYEKFFSLFLSIMFPLIPKSFDFSIIASKNCYGYFLVKNSSNSFINFSMVLGSNSDTYFNAWRSLNTHLKFPLMKSPAASWLSFYFYSSFWDLATNYAGNYITYFLQYKNIIFSTTYLLISEAFSIR